MTEYDYSPDAYARYIAKQQGIARWVDETLKHRPSNPFVATSTGRDDGILPYHLQMQSPVLNSRTHGVYDYPSRQVGGDHGYRTISSQSQSKLSYMSLPAGRHGHSSHSRHASDSHPSPSSSHTLLYPTSPPTYPTVHPNPSTPTYIYPSQAHPTVVPLNGGNSGYVIVPQAGTAVRVFSNFNQMAQQPLYDQPIDGIMSPTSSRNNSGRHLRRHSRW